MSEDHLEKMLEQLTQIVIQNNQENSTRMSNIENSLTRLENDHGEKLSALYDAREVQMDVNERILETLSRMETKLDKISLKVAAHESALKRAK